MTREELEVLAPVDIEIILNAIEESQKHFTFTLEDIKKIIITDTELVDKCIYDILEHKKSKRDIAKYITGEYMTQTIRYYIRDNDMVLLFVLEKPIKREINKKTNGGV